jgi:uncharacterized protein YjbI with pentapeptide repeats
MKVIKPLKLGLLHRVFENDQRCYFVVTIFFHFDVDEPKKLLGEVGMWKFVSDELMGEGGILDEGNSKVSGEVLVTGRCYPHGGKPAQVSFVRVKMATMDKRLAVLGNRRYKLGVPTVPESFTEMPVDWAHAFGGEGYDKNPHGKGFAPVTTAEGNKVHELPNIEWADKLIVGPKDRPMPASFSPYELTWPQRFSKVGTYDQNWVETRFPGVAADLDPRFYSVAPEDQWIQGYFKSDEAFLIENMHPTRSRIEGKLPGFVTRAFIEQERAGGELVFREIAMRIDTVRFFPHRERVIVAHRGMIEIAEDDAADIKTLLIACDDAAAPRTADHYRAAMQLRTNKEKAGMAGLKDSDLLPPGVSTPYASDPDNDVRDIMPKDNPLRDNMERRRQQEQAKAKALLEAKGIDPKTFGYDEVLGDDDPVPPPNDIEGAMEWADRQVAKIEKLKIESEAKRKELEAKSRAAYAAQGMDYDKLLLKTQKESAGPPKFTAKGHVQRLRDLCKIARDGGAPLAPLEAQIEDPQYLEQLATQEQQMFEMYRRSAHRQYPVDTLSIEQSENVRAVLSSAKMANIAMLDQDFCGVDLSGLDLSGIDLTGAFLESVNLEGTNLSGAKLAGAVIARGRMIKTNFNGADLRGANLGDATIDNATFDGADLTGVMFSLSTIKHTSFVGGKLERAQFYESKIGEGVDFSRVSAKWLLMLRVDMPGARFEGADFSNGAFAELDLTGANFNGAILEKTTFLTCKLDRSSFRRGKYSGMQVVHGSSAEDADFSESEMKNANFRDARLVNAKFGHAELYQADFSNANLTGANMYQAKARQSMFVRTNLTNAGMISIDFMNAILSKSILHGTDLSGCNLFGADLSRVRVDGRTRIQDTNMNKARVLPRSKQQ